MDQPKLTLVENSLIKDPSNSNDSNEQEEGGWFDACDLEGVDVEEVNEDNVGFLIIKDREPEEGERAERRAFEFFSCSECDIHGCSRPVKEICGHIKCRNCFLTSDNGCRQCISMRISRSEHKHAKSGPNMEEEEEEMSCNDENTEDEELVIIKPNEYIFELGETSGSKSIAVVSSETLKELGIQRDDDSIINNETIDDGSGSDNEVNASAVSAEENEMGAAQNSESSRESNVQGKGKKKTTVYTDHIIIVMEPESESGLPEAKNYKCLKCDAQFAQEYKRKYHVFCDPRNGRRPFVCHCSEEFISQSHYMYHVRSKHTGEKPYKCPVCSQSFIQKVKLNRHMITHTSKPVKADNSTYLCAYCKKRFNSLGSCRRHIRNHTEDKPFICTTCDKAFKQKYSLDLHERTHLNQRPHQCPDCSKAFSTAKDMRRHYLCHTGELPFKCAFRDCEAKFRRKDNLERHIRQTHKLSETMARVLGNEAAKKYEEDKTLSDPAIKLNEKGKRKKAALNGVIEVITGI